jgi:hypothetical protein
MKPFPNSVFSLGNSIIAQVIDKKKELVLDERMDVKQIMNRQHLTNN